MIVYCKKVDPFRHFTISVLNHFGTNVTWIVDEFFLSVLDHHTGQVSSGLDLIKSDQGFSRFWIAWEGPGSGQFSSGCINYVLKTNM